MILAVPNAQVDRSGHDIQVLDFAAPSVWSTTKEKYDCLPWFSSTTACLFPVVATADMSTSNLAYHHDQMAISARKKRGCGRVVSPTS